MRKITHKKTKTKKESKNAYNFDSFVLFLNSEIQKYKKYRGGQSLEIRERVIRRSAKFHPRRGANGE